MKTELKEFLAGEGPILDVRAPSEYQLGHIPGAVSFPLFSDEERAEIGTIYKKKGQKNAIKRGLEIVGPKMVSFIEKAEEYGSDSFRMYCWRGGMRSGSMSWLLEKYGFQVAVLQGGYKAYRRSLHQFFEGIKNLIILTGNTGCGKTRVLQQLVDLGHQVIDLEQLANHQGSSFGNQKTTGQPTTEMFQNNLYELSRMMDPKKPVWLEDESICIGQVHLPESLFEAMQDSRHVLLEKSEKERVELLLDDYAVVPPEKLIEATNVIGKKLGYDLAEEARESIKSGDLSTAARIILKYYDRMYDKSIAKKKEKIVGIVNGTDLDDKEIAQKLVEKYEYQTDRV
jgi:tRNA 2-selenouridine synthase